MTELGLAARVRRTAVRTLTGAGVLLVAGAVAAAPALWPVASPAEPDAVALTAVDVPPAPTTLVCPGPLRLPTEPEPGGDVLYDPQFDPSPEASASVLTAVSVPPEPGGDAAAGELRPLVAGTTALPATPLDPAPDGAVASVVPDTALVVATQAARDRPAWSAGAVGVTTTTGDLRGLAAASCRAPSAETWLVGGSTALGSSARLVLQNPGSTPASVRLELWGPGGAVELAGSPEYLVPAGSERVVLLEGVAAEQARVVVRLTASGGLVTGYLQDSQLRGLVPAGVDLVVAGTGPAERQVVPGVSVTTTAIDGADTAALRLLAPGDEGGTASISLLGPGGAVALPGADEVELRAGEVLDVPLAGLAEGAWTAVVTSDVPVVAGALVTRGQGVGLPDAGTLARAPLDRAWAPALLPGTSGALALPLGDGALTLGAVTQAGVSGPARATLDVLGASGDVLATHGLTLTSGATASVPLADLLPDDAAAGARAAALVLRTDDPRVVWAAVLERADPAGGMIAVLSPVAPRTAQPEVLVQVG
ncbi:DUF5719 family protein [Actinotalea solisilvae]|uniref:DUF5719 family protein n=1 Tax=Actinotalea solisilvae TaxID=2072922 RepID=UPI0018F142CB|nr:DUF5719 family protein [Actinotalea solisilvae]